MSRPLVQLLDDLVTVADLFTRSFFLVVEDIPKVFADALAACGARQHQDVVETD